MQPTVKNIVKVALPIMLSTLTVQLVNLIDTLFLTKLGEAQVGAAGNGGILLFVLVFAGSGISFANQILSGQSNGAHNYSQVGALFRNALMLISISAALIFTFLFFGSPLFLKYLIQSEAVYEYGLIYLRSMSVGVWFTMFNFLFSSFYVATANTKIISISTLVIGLTNAFLDYGLIFGNLGMPELGIQGAAIASVIAQAMGTITYLVYSNMGANNWFAKYSVLVGPKISFSVSKDLMRTGLPLVGQNFLSMAGWFVFFTLIEKLGERELAVSHVSRSIYALLMTPIFGFSDSANSFVSNAIGAKKYNEIWKIIWRASYSSIAIMAGIALLCITFLPQLLSLYTTNAEFIELTKPIMYIIFLAVPLFCLAFVAYRSLAGTGKTQLTFAIELTTIVVYCIYLFSGYHQFNFSLLQYWYSEYIYFGSLYSLSLWFLYLEIKKLRLKERS